MIEIINDSKLQSINEYAFYDSKINIIRIPSELVDLKEGWRLGIDYLTKISVNNANVLKYRLSNENPRISEF